VIHHQSENWTQLTRDSPSRLLIANEMSEFVPRLSVVDVDIVEFYESEAIIHTVQPDVRTGSNYRWKTRHSGTPVYPGSCRTSILTHPYEALMLQDNQLEQAWRQTGQRTLDFVVRNTYTCCHGQNFGFDCNERDLRNATSEWVTGLGGNRWTAGSHSLEQINDYMAAH
jgi:hypothetical protein